MGLNIDYTTLCKINGVILYVKVHHKKPNDICYSVFYFVWVGFKRSKHHNKLYFKSVSLCHSELVSESNQLSVYTIYW